MLDIQFLNFVLQQLTAALIVFSATYPANITPPVQPIEVKGMVSNVKMVYDQDMFNLGTGNPLLTINPVDPRGIVIPTSTIDVPRPDPIVIMAKPMYNICPEYPNGGAPSNVKCGN